MPDREGGRPEWRASWRRVGLGVLGILLLAAPPGFAAPLAVGGTMPALEFEDQHGERRSVTATTRVVLLTRDMTAGDLVKGVLATDGRRALESRDALYVADVSAMPGFAFRLFALPKLRDRAYPILLDRDGVRTRDLPYSEGRVTVLGLAGFRVTSVEEAATEAELRAAFDRAAAPSPLTPPR